MKNILYILRSLKDSKRYIGITCDLQKRISEHQNGLTRCTKGRRPFKLIHTEHFKSEAEAMRKEKFYKSGKGREYLKTIGL
ncbi:GIY-YIG nuclease family protein [Candidatus Peregrinibacteria bacterium]|nr:MAG: GIY-YIG nuclease family protein [Candidatus Peregrinibacteria bacterium]